MTKRLILLIVLALTLGLAVKATVAQGRGPSTPEERKRAVEIATLLENDPLNKNAKDLSRELLLWLIQVPDVNVKLCSNVLGDYSKIKGDYSPTIITQMGFSQAKFVIEHPEQANDDFQLYLAGVEGALKTYENIKKGKPKVKFEPLEQLLVKQQAGQLADFVRDAMSGCKAKQ